MSGNVLRRGDSGPVVERLQDDLSTVGYHVVARGDAGYGDYGPRTEAAVEAFQEANDLYPDGDFGPLSRRRLDELLGREIAPWPQIPAAGLQNTWARYELQGPFPPGYRGYKRFTVRDDVGHALGRVDGVLRAWGSGLLSSGGKRYLEDGAGRNRSATSLHYLGRAVDLWIYAAMQDPETDPFVCVRDPLLGDRRYRVYARGNGSVTLSLDAIHKRGTTRVTGSFIDLTQIMADHGFQGIPARRSAWRKENANYGGTEWWHFQYEEGLELGVTTFGDELLRVYTQAELFGTAPWSRGDAVWRGGRFA